MNLLTEVETDNAASYSNLGAFFLLANFANAATIEVRRMENRNLNFIFVEGEFKEGDSQKFNNIAIGQDAAIVMFDSPGGLIGEALSIGRTIYIKGFSTGVGSGSTCASACGLAWLAGREKFVFPTSQVGFHAVYTDPDSTMRISGGGNALVGAYLQQLGFNEELIVYATDTEPTSMQWLTATDAERFRLNVTVIEGEAPATREDEVAAYSLPEFGPLPDWRPAPPSEAAGSRHSPARQEDANQVIEKEGSYTKFDYIFGESIEKLYPNFSKKVWRFASPDIYFTYVGISVEYDPYIGNYTFIFGYDETDRLYDVCNVSRYNTNSRSLFIACKIGGEHLVGFEGSDVFLDGRQLSDVSYN